MTETTPQRQNLAPRALVRTVLASAIGAVVLAGCGLGGPSVDPANDPAPERVDQNDPAPGQGGSDGVTDSDGFDLVSFCSRAIPLTAPVEREYIGSDEHVEDFRDLRDVAPDDLDPIIALLIDHYELDVSPSDPESQNFENFPTDVQQAGQLLGAEINARC